MKKNEEFLSLFIHGQPAFETEFTSIRGDKFRDALPFTLKIVCDFREAQVIVWNGVTAPKSSAVGEEILKRLQDGVVLLYVSEPRTLFKGHPFLKFISLENIKVVELSGTDLLPEEILMALQRCWEKIKHV